MREAMTVGCMRECSRKAVNEAKVQRDSVLLLSLDRRPIGCDLLCELTVLLFALHLQLQSMSLPEKQTRKQDTEEGVRVVPTNQTGWVPAKMQGSAARQWRARLQRRVSVGGLTVLESPSQPSLPSSHRAASWRYPIRPQLAAKAAHRQGSRINGQRKT